MRPLKKKTKIVFQDQLSLNAGQKYCRMIQGEHSAILSTFIKLPFVIKVFVLSNFEWPLTLDRFYCSSLHFCTQDKISQMLRMPHYPSIGGGGGGDIMICSQSCNLGPSDR